MPAFNKSPNIMLWNAQSITSKSKQIELDHFIITEKIDIIIIVETFLKPHHQFSIKNFTIYRQDRLHIAHGGVALAVNNSISHKFKGSLNTQIIENIAIELCINNSPVLIFASYCPKNSCDFEDDIRLLTSHSSQFMIFGDFNAKHTSWNCKLNNKSGNSLYALQQSLPFMIYNTADHTHYPHSGRTPSTIDLVVADVNFFFDISTRPGVLSSDHDPIVCIFDQNVKRSDKKFFDYNNADWNLFRRYIASDSILFRPIRTTNDIDTSLHSFTHNILSAQSSAIPIKKAINKSSISYETKQLIKEKNTLKRRWQRTNIEPIKSILKCELNRLQKQINNNIKSNYKNIWDKNLSNTAKSSKKLWNISKKFRGKATNNTAKIKINGLPANDDEKVNHLAFIFQQAHTITADFTHHNDSTVKAAVSSFNYFSHSNAFDTITNDEIYSIIKSLKPYKSPGPDSIQNILLKNLPHPIYSRIFSINVSSLVTGPAALKLPK